MTAAVTPAAVPVAAVAVGVGTSQRAGSACLGARQKTRKAGPRCSHRRYQWPTAASLCQHSVDPPSCVAYSSNKHNKYQQRMEPSKNTVSDANMQSDYADHVLVTTRNNLQLIAYHITFPSNHALPLPPPKSTKLQLPRYLTLIQRSFAGPRCAPSHPGPQIQKMTPCR